MSISIYRLKKTVNSVNKELLLYIILLLLLLVNYANVYLLWL